MELASGRADFGALSMAFVRHLDLGHINSSLKSDTDSRSSSESVTLGGLKNLGIFISTMKLNCTTRLGQSQFLHKIHIDAKNQLDRTTFGSLVRNFFFFFFFFVRYSRLGNPSVITPYQTPARKNIRKWLRVLFWESAKNHQFLGWSKILWHGRFFFSTSERHPLKSESTQHGAHFLKARFFLYNLVAEPASGHDPNRRNPHRQLKSGISPMRIILSPWNSRYGVLRTVSKKRRKDFKKFAAIPEIHFSGDSSGGGGSVTNLTSSRLFQSCTFDPYNVAFFA